MRFSEKKKIARNKFRSVFRTAAASASADLCDNFFGWLRATIGGTALISAIKRTAKYIRSVGIVRTTFTVISYVVTFLTVTAVFFVILPIAALVAFAAIFCAVFTKKRAVREMTAVACGKKVSVLFPQKLPQSDSGNFFEGLCHDLCKSEDSVTVVVSPYFLSTRGLGGRGGYITVRRESERIFIVRRYVFFAIRRKVIEQCAAVAVYYH